MRPCSHYDLIATVESHSGVTSYQDSEHMPWNIWCFQGSVRSQCGRGFLMWLPWCCHCDGLQCPIENCTTMTVCMYFINIGITYQYICCYRVASTWMGERLHSCLYFVWINLSKFTVRYIVWSGYSFHNIIFHSDILEMMNQLTWFGVVLSIHKVSCCLKYPRPTRIYGWWTIVTALYNITTSVLTSEMVLAFLTTSMKPVLGPVAMQP